MKKIISLALTIIMCLTIGTVMTGCKDDNNGAYISKEKWSYMVGDNDETEFTLFDCQSEKAFILTYSNCSNEEVGTATIFTSSEFVGETIDNFRVTSVDAYYTYGNTIKKYVADDGNWFNGNWSSKLENYDGEKPTSFELFWWLYNYVDDNYSSFNKTGETDNTVVYSATDNGLQTINTETQKVFTNSTISEVCLTFEKSINANNIANRDALLGSSDWYRLDSISVSTKDGLLFAIKDIGAVVTPFVFEKTFSKLVSDSNFTLKGGEGIDYGEYYFTENAVKIYTPNNPNIEQREGYLTADYTNNTANYITKKADGSWNFQEISIVEFENRKQTLMTLYLDLLVEKGVGCVKELYGGNTDLGNEYFWVENEMLIKGVGYDLAYRNIEIRVKGDTTTRSTDNELIEMTFDYVMFNTEESVTHHFELTNVGATVVSAPNS